MPRCFNERPSPTAESRRVQALQILGQLARNHNDSLIEILHDLSLMESDFDEVREFLYQEAVEAEELEECGSCDHYHRPDFRGDCRNDDERFPSW